MMGEARFDYIIVGAGSAGCVLANRLTEDPSTRVLLIEAGPWDRDPLIHIPLGLGKMHQYGLHDWGYRTDPEPALNARRLQVKRGKVVGGSSSVNVMAYTRGHPGDYDRWAANGATGWSFADVLPYFKRTECWEAGETEYRGGSGLVGTEFARTIDPLYDAWVDAARALGFPVTPDLNGEQPEGFGRGQYTIRDGRRSSAATAYLRPARKRANLTVAVRALATRIILAGRRAVGVEYLHRGSATIAHANAEILLAGGVFNTPQLLMLSGIGPAAHVAEFGITPVLDLPVGRNLQDHPVVQLWYTRPQPGPFRRTMRFDRMAVAMLRAQLFGTGPATVVPGGLYAYVRIDPASPVPDTGFMFRGAPAEARLWFPGLRPAYLDGYGIRPVLLHPASRGEVRLRSTDPRAPVKILGNLLADPVDLAALIARFRIARSLANHPALDGFRGEERAPGIQVQSDGDIEAWVRSTAITANHPCGTCAMGGPDPVLDPSLRVRGTEGLRVVDASAMPDLVSGNINACVLMLAERAADLIRGKSLL